MAKKEGRVQIAVPKGKEKHYSRLFYTMVYKDDPIDGFIYKTIDENPFLTVHEIRYILRKEGIERSPMRLKNFAKRVGLPIKDVT